TYDTEWANVSNTPFRLYKQWIHEGGISTPMILRWPEVIEPGNINREPAQLIDVMPTLVDVAQTSYPENYEGHPVLPMEGKSLFPIFNGNEMVENGPLFWEFRGSRAVRKGPWKLVAERGKPWQLYHISKDRTERHDVSDDHPDLTRELGKQYDRWAKRTGARNNEKAVGMSPVQQDRYLYKKEKDKH
ncbi:MAG TPA: sulfatase/phosphatase domain-containing protein, partial [Bacteroidales bacterium]|nr:sulfatase/phosphatase domain-containing protein [Bacteroidales bacterium]